MYFNGTIIITDPCYLMKDREEQSFKFFVMSDEEKAKEPKLEDFISFKRAKDYPDVHKCEYSKVPYWLLPDKDRCLDTSLQSAEWWLGGYEEDANNLDEPEEYRDFARMEVEYYKKEIARIKKRMSNVYYSETQAEEYRKYHDADFEWSFETLEDRVKCDYGDDLPRLGIRGIGSVNDYGDWSCTTFDEEKNVLGHFCADSGRVCVALLEDVLRYNPKFDYHITKDWTTTLIENFEGDVELVMDEHNRCTHVVGKGNINFRTSQTGF